MFRRLVPVIALLLLIAGCQSGGAEAPSAPEDLIDARDRAIEFVHLRFGVGLAPQMHWNENQVAAEDTPDWVEYQYSALPWLSV